MKPGEDRSSSYIDDSLVHDVTYRYHLVPYGYDGVRGQPGEPIQVNTAATGIGDGGTEPGDGTGSNDDYTPPYRPYMPTGLEAQVYSSSLLELFWDRPVADRLLGYEIYRDGVYIGHTIGTSFLDDEVELGNC